MNPKERWSKRKWEGERIVLLWSLRDAVFPSSVQTRELREAFALWSSVVPVSFILELQWKRADIIITTGDGKCACAELPNGSDRPVRISFHSLVSWSLTPNRPVYFRGVAAHEIGHTLGLEHSVTPGTLMFPFLSGASLSPTRDDVEAFSNLYGLVPDETSVSSCLSSSE